MRLTPEQAREIAEMSVITGASFFDVCKEVVDEGIKELKRRLAICQDEQLGVPTGQE